ncbi:hypothetical protein SKAU_G00329390 [Synaphobranchus kaupii]|uniref:Sialomucin core protein 24 n=1 Tax=Synaphobranchus kaupii TaxID=118154 RepID=A0A9Q1EQH2_SYNKA|nr:hypothetical protein SKAU_G00329390 [Synaphobranchus kaupii]
MVCKALQLLVTWPLLTSCFFVFLSCAITTAHSETRTELSTVTPATVTLRPTATTSQTTVASQMTRSTVSSASMITTRTISTLKTSTNQPPVSIAAGATKTTAQTHTASTFDTGSFIGGMVLALSLTLVLFLGYKFFCSSEEHDAII